uniref:G-protein coupled receptors family 2 profile 1 domain-containing protein n=1 Tax=Knipowitschia caucasica TaxID=637954 RepID=A0AAV2JRJ1_KNICA
METTKKRHEQIYIICLYTCFGLMVEAIHPDCAIISQHLRARDTCNETRESERQNRSLQRGCITDWDGINCWLRAEIGQVVNISCGEVFQPFTSYQGWIYRNCTSEGWSVPYPPYEDACEFSEDPEPESETSYLSTFRQVYTVGYATSLVSLITAIVVFSAFSVNLEAYRIQEPVHGGRQPTAISSTRRTGMKTRDTERATAAEGDRCAVLRQIAGLPQM